MGTHNRTRIHYYAQRLCGAAAVWLILTAAVCAGMDHLAPPSQFGNNPKAMEAALKAFKRDKEVLGRLLMRLIEKRHLQIMGNAANVSHFPYYVTMGNYFIRISMPHEDAPFDGLVEPIATIAGMLHGADLAYFPMDDFTACRELLRPLAVESLPHGRSLEVYELDPVTQPVNLRELRMEKNVLGIPHTLAGIQDLRRKLKESKNPKVRAIILKRLHGYVDRMRRSRNEGLSAFLERGEALASFEPHGTMILGLEALLAMEAAIDEGTLKTADFAPFVYAAFAILREKRDYLDVSDNVRAMDTAVETIRAQRALDLHKIPERAQGEIGDPLTRVLFWKRQWENHARACFGDENYGALRPIQRQDLAQICEWQWTGIRMAYHDIPDLMVAADNAVAAVAFNAAVEVASGKISDWLNDPRKSARLALQGEIAEILCALDQPRGRHDNFRTNANVEILWFFTRAQTAAMPLILDLMQDPRLAQNDVLVSAFDRLFLPYFQGLEQRGVVKLLEHPHASAYAIERLLAVNVTGVLGQIKKELAKNSARKNVVLKVMRDMRYNLTASNYMLNQEFLTFLENDQDPEICRKAMETTCILPVYLAASEKLGDLKTSSLFLMEIKPDTALYRSLVDLCVHRSTKNNATSPQAMADVFGRWIDDNMSTVREQYVRGDTIPRAANLLCSRYSAILVAADKIRAELDAGPRANLVAHIGRMVALETSV